MTAGSVLSAGRFFAPINAEELGITRENVTAEMESDNPSIRRFLGAEGNSGESMGLDQRWIHNIVAATGNYGEMFDRNLGKGSPLKIDRGINALWNAGGLMYAPPIR
jgi:general L-amino acid transport system substrate-binding protein